VPFEKTKRSPLLFHRCNWGCHCRKSTRRTPRDKKGTSRGNGRARKQKGTNDAGDFYKLYNCLASYSPFSIFNNDNTPDDLLHTVAPGINDRRMSRAPFLAPCLVKTNFRQSRTHKRLFFIGAHSLGARTTFHIGAPTTMHIQLRNVLQRKPLLVLAADVAPHPPGADDHEPLPSLFLLALIQTYTPSVRTVSSAERSFTRGQKDNFSECPGPVRVQNTPKYSPNPLFYCIRGQSITDNFFTERNNPLFVVMFGQFNNSRV
jgi:hypothetical protein